MVMKVKPHQFVGFEVVVSFIPQQWDRIRVLFSHDTQGLEGRILRHEGWSENTPPVTQNLDIFNAISDKSSFIFMLLMRPGYNTCFHSAMLSKIWMSRHKEEQNVCQWGILSGNEADVKLISGLSLCLFFLPPLFSPDDPISLLICLPDLLFAAE